MTFPISTQPQVTAGPPDIVASRFGSRGDAVRAPACRAVLVLLVAACGGGAGSAPTGASPDSPAGEEAEVRSYPPNLVSRAEIDERGANAHNAMQFLRRLRPAWLRSRGSNSLTSAGAMYPVVYIDNIRRPGGLSALFQVPLSEVRRMEFIGPGDATTRWGTGHQSGVILIATGR